MVHDTQSRRKAKELMAQSGALMKESKALAGIDGTEIMIQDRVNRALELKEEAGKLMVSARLEDLTVRQEPLIKQTKKGGKRTYYRWVASWREGNKTRKVYLGSVNRLSHADALQKARKMKAEALGIGK